MKEGVVKGVISIVWTAHLPLLCVIERTEPGSTCLSVLAKWSSIDSRVITNSNI